MDPTVGTLIAAVVAALAAWIIAARRLSGKISNSEAVDLWRESSAIREWSAQRIAELTETVTRLEQRVIAVEDERLRLLKEMAQLRGTIAGLRNEIVNLTEELRLSRLRVMQLEEAAGATRGD